MHVYRFRILVDEQDDFLRDIEIKPSQTFLEFQQTLLQAVGIEGNELSSFFICDNAWNKIREITLIDMGMNAEQDEDGNEEDARESQKQKFIPVEVMAEVKIKDAIDDPHQRMTFEYDFLNPRVFFIELMKIVDADPAKNYPLCSRKEGTLNLAVAPAALPFFEEDEQAAYDEIDEMIKSGNLEEQIDDNYTTEPDWM